MLSITPRSTTRREASPTEHREIRPNCPWRLAKGSPAVHPCKQALCKSETRTPCVSSLHFLHFCTLPGPQPPTREPISGKSQPAVFSSSAYSSSAQLQLIDRAICFYPPPDSSLRSFGLQHISDILLRRHTNPCLFHSSHRHEVTDHRTPNAGPALLLSSLILFCGSSFPGKKRQQ